MRGLDVLFRLLPATFRAEYGEELRATLLDHWRTVRTKRGPIGRTLFWCRQAAAIVALAVELRVGASTVDDEDGGTAMLDGVGQDLRHAARGMLRQPGFTVVTALTLGLGIGASTAVFSAVHAVLFRPLPYESPDRIVTVVQSDTESGERSAGVSAANLRDLRDRAERLESVAVAEPWGLDLQLEDRAANLRTWAVSQGFFDALGAQPALGRSFAPEEYEAGSEKVVLLGHGSWTDRFGADPSIVGRTLVMEGEAHRVVGVLPPAFNFPDEAEVWMPRPDKPWDASSRAADFMVGVGRIAPGASLTSAQDEVDRVAASLREDFPEVNEDVGLALTPLPDHLVGDVRTPLFVLFGAVGVVLLIACANVAGLLLARGRQREREYAVRRALGAGVGRIVRQVTVEGALLAGVGGAAGLVLAYGGVEVIQSLGPDHLPRIEELRIDGTVLGFAVLASALSALAAGIAPALHLARPELRDVLSEGSRGTTSGRRSTVARSRLVVAEVACAVVLVIGAGLLVKSFDHLLDKELGFDPENRLAVQVFAYGYEGTGLADFVNGALEGMRAIPGVRDVALTTSVPGATDATISGIDIDVPFWVEGRAAPPRGQEPIASAINVTAGYFGLLDIPIVAGRDFARTDDPSAPPVVIVNEALARRHFGSGRVVGERLSVLYGDSVPTTRTVVGVAADVRPTGFESEPQPELYVPLTQVGSGSLTFVLRAEGDAAALANPAREAIWRANPAQAVWGAATLETLLDDWLEERRFNLYLLTGFAVVALLLSAIGVYGLVSFSVQRRVAELGVRRALGGSGRDILALVAREGAGLALAGIALGVAGALLLTRFLEGMLLDVEPTDPATFGTLAAFVFAVVLAATLVPALRATRIDPAEALRDE